MFDFLFKRSKTSLIQPVSREPEPAREDQRVSERVSGKQEALAQAEALHDESAAADFILQCQFADARLKAAMHVQSKAMLERVLHATRNTDRRVAKLMQARLDGLKRREASEQRAQYCLSEAQQLAHAPLLAANQVAELDCAWRSIDDVPEKLRASFDGMRTVLSVRLERQTELQRAARHLLSCLRKSIGEGENTPVPDIEQALREAEQEMTTLRSSPEASSLPRHLISEFEQLSTECRRRMAELAQYRDAMCARSAALESWEAGDIASLSEKALRRTWQDLPFAGNGDSAAALDVRFQHLLQRVADVRRQQQPTMQEPPASRQHFVTVLESFEKAVQEGALQAAVEHEKALRAMDMEALRLTERQSAQLAKARAELHRLQSWARWGGNVSREELLKAAEELPSQSLDAPELAKKVGSLRERWKSLDASAGPVSRELWIRFDAACTVAYAPAAVHFKRLAEERQRNQAEAQALIDGAKQFAETSRRVSGDAADVNWKDVANFCMRSAQAWRQLGAIDRKERKRLDAEFARAIRALSEPLAQRRAIEIERREKLIEEASNLDASERTAIEDLRALQERWRENAKSLPLECKDEQALWQRFRGACDSVFERRKGAAAAADEERRQHLRVKEALCATLENAAGGSATEVSKILRDTAREWGVIGPVPRTAENAIEARYKSAVVALQRQMDVHRKTKWEADRRALCAKLRLCREVEAAVANRSAVEAGMQEQWSAAWQALPALAAPFEKRMRKRFDAALEASRSHDRQYATGLEQGRAALLRELLRAEILLGVDSPIHLAQERLQLQVEALQSSLKSGRSTQTDDTLMLRLCEIAALIDEDAANRLERIINHVGKP